MWIRLKFAKAKAFGRMKEWEKKSIHKIENDFQLSNCLQNNALFMTAFFCCCFGKHVANGRNSSSSNSSNMKKGFAIKTTHARIQWINFWQVLLFDAVVCFSDIVWHAHKNAYKILIIWWSVLFWSDITYIIVISNAICAFRMIHFTNYRKFYFSNTKNTLKTIKKNSWKK